MPRFIKKGDVITRDDAIAEHILVIVAKSGEEHVYPLYASTQELRKAEIESLLRTCPYPWVSAYDCTRND